jgi:hypothetical protein
MPLGHRDSFAPVHPRAKLVNATFITMPQKRSFDYSLIIVTLYGVFENYVE